MMLDLMVGGKSTAGTVSTNVSLTLCVSFLYIVQRWHYDIDVGGCSWSEILSHGESKVLKASLVKWNILKNRRQEKVSFNLLHLFALWELDSHKTFLTQHMKKLFKYFQALFMFTYIMVDSAVSNLIWLEKIAQCNITGRTILKCVSRDGHWWCRSCGFHWCSGCRKMWTRLCVLFWSPVCL